MAERVWSDITSATRANRKNLCWACGGKDWPCAYRTHLKTDAVMWICGLPRDKFFYAADGREISGPEAHGNERRNSWTPTARKRLAARDAKAESRARKPAADRPTCDAVYEKVLGICPVSDEHRAALLRRPGMTDAIIQTAGYATARTLDGVGLLIRDIKGADKVPGMPEPGASRFQMVAGAMLVPVRAGGYIVGLRQRVETEDGGKKYLWLPGSVPAVHFPAVTPGRQSGRLLVTEGEIKADLSTAIGDYTLSIPGVSSWRLAIDEVEENRLVVADGGSPYNELVIALDADYRRKFGVAQAVAAMATEALARNIPSSVLDWPEALGKGLDDFLTRPGAGRGPDLYSGATFRPVTEALVEELQALADRLLQEEQDRRDAAAAEAGGVDESPAIGGDDEDEEYDRLAGDALRAMIDETQEVGSPEHLKKMEIEEAKEFAVDAAKVAVRRIVDKPRKELLLDDDLRRAFLQHVETLGEAECTRLRIFKPTIELFRKVDTILSNDGFAAPARRALAGYLGFDRSEIGFALRMADRFRGEIMHAGGLGWYCWDGMAWVHDPDRVRVMARAQQLAYEIEGEIEISEMCAFAGVFGPSVVSKAKSEYKNVAASIHGPSDGEMKDAADKERSEHSKFVSNTRCNNFLKSVVALLRPHLEVDDKALDAHPHLLNTRSGIVDLRTGVIGPHDPSMLLTQITSSGWSPTKPCPRWNRFISEVLAEADGSVDPEYVRYFKALLGYSLWGDAKEQKIISVWGEGSNGKSLLFNLVKQILGSYARTIEPDLIIKADADSGGGPRADILSLRAARFIVASEPERGEAMAEGLVKRLTGDDELSARYGYSNQIVEFKLVGKIFLLCNSLLRISGTDRGIWRRQEVIKFLRLWRLPGEENDPKMRDLPPADLGLKSALADEMDGILAWLVEGAVQWHREGLIRPRRVTDAVVEYRGEQDRVLQFLSERVERDDRRGNVVSQKEMYEAYVEWCKASGTQSMAKDRLKGALKDHGIVDGRNGQISQLWKGVRLLPQPAQTYRDGQAGGGGYSGVGWGGGRRDADLVQPPAPQQPRSMLF